MYCQERQLHTHWKVEDTKIFAFSKLACMKISEFITGWKGAHLTERFNITVTRHRYRSCGRWSIFRSFSQRTNFIGPSNIMNQSSEIWQYYESLCITCVQFLPYENTSWRFHTYAMLESQFSPGTRPCTWVATHYFRNRLSFGALIFFLLKISLNESQIYLFTRKSRHSFLHCLEEGCCSFTLAPLQEYFLTWQRKLICFNIEFQLSINQHYFEILSGNPNILLFARMLTALRYIFDMPCDWLPT